MKKQIIQTPVGHTAAPNEAFEVETLIAINYF